MNLTTVPPDALPQVWPLVQPWIADACRRGMGDQTPADLLLMCRKVEAALILIGEAGTPPVAAGIIQVRDYQDGHRAYWILALGGSQARAWRHTLKIIEDYAARIGCDRVEFVGRPGWAALLSDYECHVSYEKRL